jgi:hypothetical protein
MATYQNPNVYVSVLNNPVVASVGASPINACIVGQAPSVLSQSDTFNFKTFTTVNQLSQPNVSQVASAPVVTVVDLYSGATYSQYTDYQLGLSTAGITYIAPGQTTLNTSGSVSGGSFNLTFYLNSTATNLGTATIAYNANASTVASAITAAIGSTELSNLNMSVSVNGTLSAGMTVQFAQTSTSTPQNIITMSTDSTNIAGGGTITSTNNLVGKWVSVTYNYNANYGNVVNLFSSFNALQSVYGTPFDSQGNINSPLSLAAQLAFQNGASQIYVMAVKQAGTTPTVTEWQTAISSLSSVSGIDTIVPLIDYSSDPSYSTFFKTFINTQAGQGFLQRLFLARDTSSTGIQTPANTLAADAENFNNQRISVFSPTCLTSTTVNTASTQQLNIAGFYGAAAVAGVFAAQSGPEVPLTHKTVQGFYTIPFPYSNQDLLTMQSSGVLVMKQDQSGNIYIRHGLTTNMSNWLTQEISIIAAQDQLYNQIKSALTTANVIGSPYTPNTAAVISATVQGALTAAVNTNLIQAYSGLQYAQSPTQPSTINIEFSYSPTFPVNYINVQFSIDPTSGTLQYSSTNSGITTTTGV